jgi:hypothetical protein
MKLTTATIRALALPEGKSEAIFFDDKLPGLGIGCAAAVAPPGSINTKSAAVKAA